MRDVYQPQFFSDVTEIRRNMEGKTGTGELVATLVPADEMPESVKGMFVEQVNQMVDTLNRYGMRHTD